MKGISIMKLILVLSMMVFLVYTIITEFQKATERAEWLKFCMNNYKNFPNNQKDCEEMYVKWEKMKRISLFDWQAEHLESWGQNADHTEFLNAITD